MENLKNTIAVVEILTDEHGNEAYLEDEKDWARYQGLRERPLQQKMFGNLVAARQLASRSHLFIKAYNDDEEQGTFVEDLFLELACDLLIKIVAGLHAIMRAIHRGFHVTTSVVRLGLSGEVLSPENLAKLRKLLWFIVCLGIHPFLELQLHPDAGKYASAGRRSSVLERKQKMMIAVGYLRCLREQPELVAVLRSHAIHCPALCVLLEQIICPQPNAEDPEAEHYATMKRQARVWMDGQLDGDVGLQSMPQIFLLQNAAQRSLAWPNSKPRFVLLFMEECGRTSSMLFMRPNGVKALVENVMWERKLTPVGRDLFKTIELMAAVLTQFPQQHELTATYYESIVGQLRCMLESPQLGPFGGGMHLAYLWCLKALSHLETTIGAFNEHLYAPVRVFYEKGLGENLPALESTFCGRVVVSKQHVDNFIIAMHSLLTIDTGLTVFHFPSTAPLVALFCMASSMPVRSAQRRMVLDTLAAAVDQHINPISTMFAFIDTPEDALVPSIAYMSTKGHVVRRPLPGEDEWRENMHNIWPPPLSLLNPSVVHIMDLLVERQKEPNSPIIPGSSAKHESDGRLASDTPWNRKCMGARIVATVLSTSLVDLTRSLNGKPKGVSELTFFDAGADIEPDVTQDMERDFIRLNLVAMVSERYGSDIIPSSNDVVEFAAIGLAAAAFVLDPSKENTDVLDKASKSGGKGKIVGVYNSYYINVYPAQVWSLVAVQLCLSLLAHLMEVDSKCLTRESITRIMPSLAIVGNCHPQKPIRQHCLEVQITASTFSTITTITDNELSSGGVAGGNALVTSGDLDRIMGSIQQQEQEVTRTVPQTPVMLAAQNEIQDTYGDEDKAIKLLNTLMQASSAKNSDGQSTTPLISLGAPSSTPASSGNVSTASAGTGTGGGSAGPAKPQLSRTAKRNKARRSKQAAAPLSSAARAPTTRPLATTEENTIRSSGQTSAEQVPTAAATGGAAAAADDKDAGRGTGSSAQARDLAIAGAVSTLTSSSSSSKQPQQPMIVEQHELEKLAAELARLPAEMAMETENIKQEVKDFSDAVERAMSTAFDDAIVELKDGTHESFRSRLATLVDDIADRSEQLATQLSHSDKRLPATIGDTVDPTTVAKSPEAGNGERQSDFALAKTKAPAFQETTSTTPTASNTAAAGAGLETVQSAVAVPTESTNDESSAGTGSQLALPAAAAGVVAAPAPQPEQKHSLKILLDELEGASLSMKAKALHLIGQLLQNGEKAAWNNVDTLAEIFLEHLQHPQQVIYMSSITGMALLSRERPQVMVERICKEVLKSQAMETMLTADARLFMAQSLLQMARVATNKLRCHRRSFIRAMLCCIQDEEVQVRCVILTLIYESVQYLDAKFMPSSALGIVKVLVAVLKHDRELQSREIAASALKEICMRCATEIRRDCIKKSDRTPERIELLVVETLDSDIITLKCHAAYNYLSTAAVPATSQTSYAPPPTAPSQSSATTTTSTANTSTGTATKTKRKARVGKS